MAAELQADHTTAKTVYFLVRNSVGQVWNGSTFEAYQTANLATYVIAATEQGTASGLYAGTMPAASAGIYNVVAKERAGGSAAESDVTVGEGELHWNGTAIVPRTSVKLASDGLDAISTTAPSGVASNFREMLVQVWRRFFKKSTLTSTQLKTYADDGTTVITTQTVSDDTVTQTQGASS